MKRRKRERGKVPDPRAEALVRKMTIACLRTRAKDAAKISPRRPNVLGGAAADSIIICAQT